MAVKVAVLADVHGNFPALQAVLENMPRVDVVICCGDLVGYYPDVNEVCAVLRNIDGLYLVRGNHDAYVIGALEPDPQKALIYRTMWTRAELTKTHFEWLATLPVELRFLWDGLTVIVRHASPWDEESYLFADSPKLNDISLAQQEILIVGHTHRPMLMSVGKGLLLNPGSVGQPRDWEPKASYALLDTQTHQIEIRRVPYNVNDFQKRIRSMGWDEKAVRILSRQKIEA